MMKQKQHLFVTVAVLLLGILLVSAISLSWGSYHVPFGRIPAVLFGQGRKLEHITIFTLRLPRIAVAMAVGCALSAAGCLLQSVTRNDLADSGMIGLNAGASLAAVLFITSQNENYYDDLGTAAVFVLPVVAMLGALCAALLLYVLSNRQGISPQRLILVGIGINIAIGAFITFYSLRTSQGTYNRVLVWTSGSLWGSSWKFFAAAAPGILLFFLLSLYKHKTLDVLALGDEVSTGLGLNVAKERKTLLFYAVMLSGIATSVAGNIGFLGLVSPHIARRLVGPKHKVVIPVSAMISTIIIVLADSLSRNVFSPIEVPAGITISLLGVPYFIYLMMKEK